MLVNTCLTCKKTFTRPNNPNREYKFCSQKCFGASPLISKSGLNEGRAWNKGTIGICKPNSGSFQKGQEPWNDGMKKVRTCKLCKGIFYGEYRVYCSTECFKEGTTKDNAHAWIDGRTPEVRKIRNSVEYKEWRKAVFERDKYTCQICGDIGVIIRANHIKRFTDYPGLRFEMTNGIVVCEKCDLKFVLGREKQWESYFNFNLMVRGLI